MRTSNQIVMEINDIIEGLNVYYEGFPNRRKGYFVLHKIVDTNPVAKSQKTYRMQVWFVNKSEKIPAFGAQHSNRIVTDAEETKVLSLLTTSITKSLLEYINTQDFKELCNDTNE